ncbi:MAG: cytochrome c peroxidase [Gammaproteobacteria bacterium]
MIFTGVMDRLLLTKFIAMFIGLITSLNFAVAGDFTDHPINAIPESLPHDIERAKLGKLLFRDTILSANNKLSCVSCHNIKKGGMDNLVRSPAANGRMTETNTPSVLNSIFNFRYHWDGSAKHYHQLLHHMISNPNIMGSSWENVVAAVQNKPEYRNHFNTLFDDGVTKANIESALHEYQKTLISPNSRFDKYLMGDENALTLEEKEGYKLFKTAGCISCHQGINVGGNLFQKLGIYKNYYEEKPNLSPSDYGKYNLTGLEEDKFVFKVPSLRNVALTAPYFHDGSKATLEEAIEAMAIYQIGQPLLKTHVDQIKLFLETLTGEMPAE